MIDVNVCRQCGNRLSTAAVEGLCPKCLARMTFQFDPSFRPASSSRRNKRDSTSGMLGKFGDYELLEEIARGGMGVVYKARQIRLDRLVALKMILAGRFASQEYIERFQVEAQAAAQLQHPNIVAIHEVGKHEGQHFFSMDYVPGPSLAQLARDHPVPPMRAARYIRLIAQAVQYAHDHGIIHRDLKPSNVLIHEQDQPKVTDFGLAKRLTGDANLTLTGEVLGSPNFAPPEQAGGGGKTVSPAGDIYSLGAILYFLITGRPPFLAESLERTLQHVLHTEPAAPRVLNPEIPKDLETICLKCLQKEPERRYSSAQALANDLGRLEQGHPIQARPVGVTGRFGRWTRRNPSLAATLIAAMAIFAAGSGGVFWQWRRAEHHAQREIDHRGRAENALERMQFEKAEELFKSGETSKALAYLAHIAETNPTNRVAAARLLSALTHRNFPWPAGRPLTHEGPVRMADFSRDGSKVVTASEDGTARVWDAKSGKPLTPPLRHEEMVRFASFSPDGQRIVTASNDGTARIWDCETGQPAGLILTHGTLVEQAVFSPDGQRIATGSKDGLARIWDAKTGRLLTKMAHRNWVNAVCFSRDGRWLATCADDHSARVWVVETGEPRTAPLLHDDIVVNLDFNEDNTKLLTSSHDETARVWDITSGVQIASARHAQQVSMARFSPEGTRIVTGSWDFTAQVWDVVTGQRLGAPSQHQGYIKTVDLSPDGFWLLTASHDNTARVWAVPGLLSGNPGMLLGARYSMEPMRHEGPVFGARFSPDARRSVTASADHTAQVWAIEARTRPCLTLDHSSEVRSAAFSPDGTRIATASADSVTIWDAASGKRLSTPIRHKRTSSEVRFSPDGRYLMAGSEDQPTQLWDSVKGKILSLLHNGSVESACFSPDGRTVATGATDNAIRVWDCETGVLLMPPLPHGQTVISIAFSPDGRKIASGCIDHRVYVWDALSGRLLFNLAHGQNVRRVLFSSDGLQIMSASEDNTARVWNAETGSQTTIAPLRHQAMVSDLVLSRDNRFVGTASADHTAQIWDKRTGLPLVEPLSHGARVYSIRFSPDATMVVTASADGTGRVWDVQTGLPLSEPLRHGGEVRHAEFSPDGNSILTASHDSSARIWDAPKPHGLIPIPPWLPQLAQAMAGKRLNAKSALESVHPDLWLRLKRQLTIEPINESYKVWLDWFLADPAGRTVSPRSRVTMQEYIQGLIDEDRGETLLEAIALSPKNTTALARLARKVLESPHPPSQRDLKVADWLSRRAVTLAPSDREAQSARREVLERMRSIADPRLDHP